MLSRAAFRLFLICADDIRHTKGFFQIAVSLAISVVRWPRSAGANHLNVVEEKACAPGQDICASYSGSSTKTSSLADNGAQRGCSHRRSSFQRRQETVRYLILVK